MGTQKAGSKDRRKASEEEGITWAKGTGSEKLSESSEALYYIHLAVWSVAFQQMYSGPEGFLNHFWGWKNRSRFCGVGITASDWKSGMLYGMHMEVGLHSKLLPSTEWASQCVFNLEDITQLSWVCLHIKLALHCIACPLFGNYHLNLSQEGSPSLVHRRVPDRIGLMRSSLIHLFVWSVGCQDMHGVVSIFTSSTQSLGTNQRQTQSSRIP